MRGRLTALLCAGALALSLLSGCGTQAVPTAGETAATTAAAKKETQAETTAAAVRETAGIAWQSDGSLNPFTSESVTNQAIFGLLYEGLFSVSNTFEAQPVLCESCGVSSDGKTWHLTLRSDAAFSDGTAVTSADVIASLNAAKASAVYKTRFHSMTSVEADGDKSVIVHLSAAYEKLPLILDVPIVQAASVSAESPVGTGPYFRSGGELIRNEKWWRGTTPSVDVSRITLVQANDPKAVRSAFEFGGADMVYTDPVSSGATDYHSDYELWSCPTTVMQYLGFNQSGRYFGNSTLRSAVTYIVDRTTIVATLYGGFGQPAALPCSPLSPFYDANLASSYTYNVSTFRSSLQASGLSATTANPVKLIVPSNSSARVAAAEFIAKAMTDAGLPTAVTALSTTAFQSALNAGSYDLFLGEVRLPPNFDLNAFFANGGGASYGGIVGDSAAQLMASALENSGNYYDLCRSVMNRGLICPILFKDAAFYATRGVVATHQAAVSNIFLEGTGTKLADIQTVYDAPASTETEAQPQTTQATRAETTAAQTTEAVQTTTQAETAAQTTATTAAAPQTTAQPTTQSTTPAQTQGGQATPAP